MLVWKSRSSIWSKIGVLWNWYCIAEIGGLHHLSLFAGFTLLYVRLFRTARSCLSVDREVEIHEQQQRKCISYYRPHENPDDLCVLSKDAAWSKQNCCGISLLFLADRHNLCGRFREDFLGHLKSFLVFWVNTRGFYSFFQYFLARTNRACNFIGNSVP